MEGSRRNGAPRFVVRTYYLVNDASIDDIISWGTFPNSFVVWSPIDFTNKLLPKYFKHKSFPSFVRRLSYYGFHSLRADAYEFAHDSFVRFQPHLLRQISRISKNATTGVSVLAPQPSNSMTEAGRIDEERFRLEQETYSIELAKFREQEAASTQMTQIMSERVQRTDELEQQLMALVGQILPDPDLLARLFVDDQPTDCLGSELVISREEQCRLQPESAGQDRQRSSEAHAQLEIMKFQAYLDGVMYNVVPGLSQLSRCFEENMDGGSTCNVVSQAPGSVHVSAGQDGRTFDSTQISASPQVIAETVKDLIETSDSEFRGKLEKAQRVESPGVKSIVPPTTVAMDFSVQVTGTKPDAYGSAMGASSSSGVFDHAYGQNIEKMDSLSFDFDTTSTEDLDSDFHFMLEAFLGNI